MTNAELLQEGINLMFAGVGFVMLFLFILIYAIEFMSKLVNTYFPEPVKAPSTKPIQTENHDLERLRPVIVAAITHHRRQQGLK
ncbi:oxaloacetate decarboxylase gamma chain [Pasteurella multocida]|uniref:oxaloacetate decarboxylase subunit gamma n=1 Tax=Pasteurella multocida TaxID=747 RepID=UPI000B74B62C|nr:oxaloacetate decarboxylase subunit gamma [Pasteurella multocida]MDG2541797.1 oxaloacetate decarboxylase subunit gamma [Pasteurella multocida]MDY0643496.1 oxaloacetate decarboxylase subunit gamma [Pasteurella multocida]MEB3476425.1 oxaloacetate decarboxylase subunit gamma [Pasteurella multocida]MEB3507260.1 oxaloacetate decarboxylase subunit gamma [Pasteurella multocida]MEE3749042.1 oxaloacetate decarboxylase subunit gamma [Pasteurella multocida]